MQLTTIISGKVTLQRKVTNVFKGLQMEVFDTNTELGWLGSTVIKANGEFKLIINKQATTPVSQYVFKIYKGGKLLHTLSSAKGGSSYVIDISNELYDAFISPALLREEEIDYFIVKGRLLSYTLKPLEGDIIFYEKTYTGKTQLLVTKSNADGFFEIKASSRLLVNENTQCKRVFFVEAEVNGSVISTSQLYQDIVQEIYVELVSTNENINPPVDFIKIGSAINIATNNDGEISELTPFSKEFDDTTSYLASVTCIDLNLVRAYILSIIYQHSLLTQQAKFIFGLFVQCSSENIDFILLMDKPSQIEKLAQAAAKNNIGYEDNELSSFLEGVYGYKENHLLDKRIKEEPISQRELFTITFSRPYDEGQQTIFLNTYFDTQGTGMDFWQEFETAIDDSDAAKHIRRRLDMIAWVGCQPDMYNSIITDFDSQPENMALKSVQQWKSYIDGVNHGNCIPVKILNDDSIDDKKKYYAQKLFEIITFHYPSQGYSGIIGRNTTIYTSTLTTNLKNFISDNPQYSFRKNASSLTDEWDYRDLPTAQLSALKEELLCLERLANVSNANAKAIAAMRLMKVTSSFDITKMTEEAFVNAFAISYDEIDAETGVMGDSGVSVSSATSQYAKKVYAQAQDYVDVAAHMGGHIKGNASQDYVLHGPMDPASETKFPTWTNPVYAPADATLSTMFGDMNTCCCEHCRSVYSPTAYFTDTLQLLHGYSFAPTASLKDHLYQELDRRRPDLKHIDLTCKNANTQIPYIDLVNEILESKIIDLNPALQNTLPYTITAKSFQTEGESADLLSYPEHKVKIPLADGGTYIDDDSFRNVYNVVMKDATKAFYPSVLPFNLPIEETRVYLKHMGYSRNDAMQLFKPVDSFTAAITDISPLNREIEFHELSPENAAIIQGSYSLVPLEQFYGILNSNYDIVDPYDTSKVINFTAANYQTKFNENIHVLIQQLKISYNQLLQLLTTEHLNPFISGGTTRKISIQAKTTGNPPPAIDTCDITELHLVFASTPWVGTFYDRLHRHVRLHKLTGWSIYDIDKAIGYVSGYGQTIDSLNTETILSLFRWSKQLGYSIDEIQSWWNSIDTYDKYRDYDCKGEIYIPPVYDSLFKNKAVINPTDDRFIDPTSSAFTNTLFIDAKETIMAAFKIDEVFFNALLSELPNTSNTNLNLADLAKFHILSKIANSYKLTFNELKDIWGLNGISFLSLFTINQFESAIKCINDFIELKLPLGYVKFLTTSTMPLGGAEYMAKEEEVTKMYASLQKNIKATCKVHNVETSADIPATSSPEFTALQDDVKKTLLNEFGKVFNAIELDTLDNLCNTQIKIKAIDNNVQFITDALTNKDAISFFLTYTGDFSDFTLNIPTGTSSTPVLHTNALLMAYQFMYRLETLFSTLKINTDLYTALSFTPATPSAPLSYFQFGDLYKIWLDSTIIGTEVFQSLNNFMQWIIWRDKNGISNADLAGFITFVMSSTSAGISTYPQKVLSLIEADENLTDLFAGSGNANLLHFTIATNPPLPVEYYLASTLQRVADINIFNKKVGVKIANVFETLLPNVTLVESEIIRSTAKAKYESKKWLSIAQPLQNILREKQREALVAYLLAHPSSFSTTIMPLGSRRWRNENDLYAFLLIDVEMKPFALTSRIKQGLCSLQLYIDRVLMNLERVDGIATIPGATALQFTGKEAIEWKKWRKWYRIWEANRKVFLYPENWIEPELRLDKTPLFERLENTLMQDEINDKNVELAIGEYLEALDEIGRLEPVTMVNVTEMDANNKEIILETYYFARTQSEPHTYYFRTFVNRKYTPWKAVDIDIKGEHVTAYYDIVSKKVFLMWLNIVNNTNVPWKGDALLSWVKSMKNYYDMPSNVDKEIIQGIDIRLHWSEFKNNKWLSSNVSRECITLSPANVLDCTFLTEFSDNQNIGSNREKFNLLTNNGTIDFLNFFKSRLYLSPLKGDGESVDVTIMFPYSLKEVTRYIHGFYFPDMYSDPVVKKDTIITRFNAQPKTNLINQKFINNRKDNLNGPFAKSWTADENPGWQSVYINLFDNNSFNNIVLAPNQPINSTSDIILGQTPKGLYNLRYHGSFNHYLPIEWSPSFYFYDDVNTFLVSPKLYHDYNNIAGIQPDPTKPNDTILNIDQLYAYFYSTDGANLVWNGNDPSLKYGFLFETFYHPWIKQYRKALYNGGVKELLGQGIHQLVDANISTADKIQFSSTYQPTSLVLPIYPSGTVEFNFSGAYSQYNWEIFFHAPMLIANRLMENQRFEEAQKWYHYIFDPTTCLDMDNGNTGNKNRFWKFRPFFEEASNTITTVQQMMNSLNSFTNQISEWRAHPFEPHVIARMRILAYMKNVVMKYLDNLIAWADNSFRRDTIESINEATNLYILALNIMGEKPQDIPPRAVSLYYTFDELLDTGNQFDDFSNIMVSIESFIPPNANIGGAPLGGASAPKMLYFCIPRNEKLMGYWKIIADRLFKIRNSMNIEGIQRQLPLYEPEIDPALLVKATAAGLSMETVMNEITNAGTLHYRFAYMLQKANELCGDVKSLGNALLSALEKKDGEQLALLRATQELNLLEQVKAIKELQLKDAENALESLLKTKEITLLKQSYYQRNSAEYMNVRERLSQTQYKKSVHLQEVSQGINATASVLCAIPKVHAQLVASGISYSISDPVKAAGDVLGLLAYISSSNSSMNATTGGYDRRKSDWDFQVDTSKIELEQIEKNIISTQIKIQIAQKELENHETQIENSSEVFEYMKSKYTNQQLYSWMVSQISATYFQSYKLAYDLARKAERTFGKELPLAATNNTNIIQYGYWDSLKKGLLAGDKLQLDLRRLDLAYIENNKREYELTKHVSLASISPGSLFDIQQTGICNFNLIEPLFELDFPSHYLRRIKSISISIPCIAGPYTTIPATLTLNSHSIRNDNSVTGAALPTPLPTTTITTINDNESIAISSSQNDSGVFELNFRDERYVPFEGKGAISNWTLSLMGEASLRQFDYDTISDVIIHIKYSAREGGDILKNNVLANLKADITNTALNLPFAQLVHLKTQFVNDWTAYLNDTDPNKKFKFKLTDDLFPFFCKGKTMNINHVAFHVQGLVTSSGSLSISAVTGNALSFTSPLVLNNGNTPTPFTKDISATGSISGSGTEIELTLTSGTLEAITELNLAISYSIAP